MFPVEIHKKLGSYVYRLIDPRNGQTFYVGKGKGNRVFQHVAAELAFDEDEDSASTKIKTIRQIKLAGLEPIHIIHRHGLSDHGAILSEAVLIDAIGGLTNIVGGHGSNEFGPANAEELIRRYKLEEMKISQDHKILALNVSNSKNEHDLYDAVRFAWTVNKLKAEKADFIFAVSQGVCRDVFVANEWKHATSENFPEFSSVINDSIKSRYGFVGERAQQEILELYIDKQLPENMRWKPGASSPIRYSWG